jgi:hypothetical protein
VQMASVSEGNLTSTFAWLADRSSRTDWQVSEGWYRYGDSNPGPVAENHVS